MRKRVQRSAGAGSGAGARADQTAAAASGLPLAPLHPGPAAPAPYDRWRDGACALLLLAVTLAVYAPALLTGRVLLPADIVPLMRPWAATAEQRFPDFRFARNQMLGPIFEYYSWRHYARERMRAGEVPLWNPNEMGGNVLLANSQSAVLYPPNVLLYLLSLPTGINLVTALHTFLTGVLMFGLLRTLGLRRVAGLTGALAWMFCGLMVVWTEFQTPTAALCWLPGALWMWELYARGRGWRWAVLGGGTAVALALLAGHLQFAFYVVLAYVLYSIGRPPARPGAASVGRWAIRPIGVLAGSLAFGAALSLSTILPVLEMGRVNFRASKPDLAASVSLRIPPVQLLGLVQPDMFGNPRDYVETDAQGAPITGHNYWGRFEYIEYAAYPGVPALVLALTALGLLARQFLSRGRARSRLVGRGSLAFAVLALVGLLLALGTPLCAALVYGVPGYKQFNATARAMCLASFGVAALAAYGVDALLAARATGGRRTVGLVVSVASAVVALAAVISFPVALDMATGSRAVASTLAPYSNVYEKWAPYELAGVRNSVLFVLLTSLLCWAVLRYGARPQPDARSRASAAAPWLLPAAVLGSLLVWGMGFNPMPPREMLGYPTETTSFLRRTPPARVASLEAPGQGIKSFIVPNFNLAAGYREVQGADSLHTWRFHHLLDAAVRQMDPGAAAPFPDPNTLHYPALAHPIFDILNVRYATTASGRPAPGPAYRKVLDAELQVWENSGALGAVWVAGAAEPVGGLQQAAARLRSPTFDARRTALLEQPAPPLDASAAGSPARLSGFAPHRLTADVDARGRGLAVFSEVAFPGWRARVDGRPAPVLTADYILRAVPVPPGRHTVVLTYEPASWRLGLHVSCLALCLASALLAHRAMCGRGARSGAG